MKDDVADYYNHNTSRFLRLGGSGDAAAIHRRIWAPGVESEQDAFLYLNQLVKGSIQPAIQDQEPGRVLDLGCGVGGTATWLVQELEIHVTGVSNSAVQVTIAQKRALQLGLQGNVDSHRGCQFVTADFMDLPPMRMLQAAYAIESFIHAENPEQFFQHVGKNLGSGGRLVMCDDFLGEGKIPVKGQSWILKFQKGWHVKSLLPVAQVKKMAVAAGFRLVEHLDLTAYLRLFHPVVRFLLAWITRLPVRSAYWENLAGGTALQICIANGWTVYGALVFEKIAPG